MLCYFIIIIIIPSVGAFFPAPLTNLTQNVTWYTILEQVYSYTGYYQWHLINSQVYSNLYVAVLQYRNCSGPMFSTSLPIGYGSCSNRPYLQINRTVMCITTGLYNNGTGFGYPDCQAAVNTTLVNNAVPVQLPNLLPTLTNTLTCADYGLPSSHSLCNFYSNWIGFNQTICMTYVSNHMGVCYTYYDPWYNYGYPQGFYSVEGYQQMNDYILWAVANNYSTSTGVRYRLFESATQALVALPILMSDNITSYYACYCFCTTNLCNTNMSTCTAGFSFNCTYSPIIGTTTSLATSTPTINTIVSTTGVTSASTTIFSNVTISVMNNSTLIVSTTTINSTLSSSTNNATAVSSTTSGFSVSNNLTSSTLGTTGTTASAAANDATTIGLAIGIGVSGLLILALTVGLIASALNRRCKKKPSSTNKVEPEKVKSDDTNEQTMFHQQAETPKQSDPPPQPLQPVRQAIRTNRTADLRMAAWSDA